MQLVAPEGGLGRRCSGPCPWGRAWLGKGPGRCLLSLSLEQTLTARETSSMAAVRYPARGPHNPIQITFPYPSKKGKKKVRVLKSFGYSSNAQPSLSSLFPLLRGLSKSPQTPPLLDQECTSLAFLRKRIISHVVST